MIRRTLSVVTLFAIAAVFIGAKADDKLSKDDKEFIKHAMRQMEIVAQESRLARTQSASDGVQHFAELTVREQDEMIKSMKEFCDSCNFSFDADPTNDDVKGKRELEKLKGKEFDRVYMSDMTRELEESLKAFNDGAKKADNHDLKKWFNKYNDAIRARHDNAEELYRKVKAKD
jgi:putative membrane protein